MSHQPAEEFLIPTQLGIESVDSVIIGEPTYPTAKVEKVEWSKVTLLTYEGQIEIESAH